MKNGKSNKIFSANSDPELERRLDQVEGDVSEIEGKCDEIIEVSYEIRSDVRSISEATKRQDGYIDDLDDQVEKNTKWILKNKKIVGVLAAIIAAGGIAALTGLDVSMLL